MRVTPAEEYHVFDVLCPDTICSRGFLWGITENDSLLYSVFSRPELESCSWKIFHYHQGCMMHTDSTYQLHIGAYDTLSSPFHHKEFAYIPGDMLLPDIQGYQTYLALKYGITLDNVPYITCSGNTLWDSEEDALFYHRVTGIGNDTLQLVFGSIFFVGECRTLHPLRYAVCRRIRCNWGQRCFRTMDNPPGRLLRIFQGMANPHPLQTGRQIAFLATLRTTTLRRNSGGFAPDIDIREERQSIMPGFCRQHYRRHPFPHIFHGSRTSTDTAHGGACV